MRLELNVTAVSFDRSAIGTAYTLEIRAAAAGFTQAWADVRASSVPLSDPSQRFEPRSTDAIATLGGWHGAIDVAIHEYVLVWARLSDAADGGPRGHIIYRWPARQFFFEARVGAHDQHFTFNLTSSYGSAPAGRVIYARRGNTATDSHTLRVDVSGPVVFGMIHPVIPVPREVLTQVVMPAWMTEPNTQFRVTEHEPPHPVNPSVFPAWHGSGDPDRSWLYRWESEICINVLAHRGITSTRGQFAAFEQQIQWDYEVVDAGPARPEVVFTSRPRGYEVRAFARGEGEVRVFASYRGQRISELRALVRRPITFAARTIVLLPTEWRDAGAHAQQRDEMEALSTADLAVRTRRANEYLRQVGLALPEMTIEHRTVAASRTVGLTEDQFDHYAEPYGRTRTITFLVIHSTEPRDYLGNASGIVGSAAPHSDRRQEPTGLVTAAFTDRGSPSTSWIPPNGLSPGPAAEPQTMRFMVEAPVDRPVVYLVYATRPAQGPLHVSGFGGRTMAHEIGHVLGLRHRGEEEGMDGLPAYGGENLMVEGSGLGDLDIAQAKVLWASPLLRRQR